MQSFSSNVCHLWKTFLKRQGNFSISSCVYIGQTFSTMQSRTTYGTFFCIMTMLALSIRSSSEARILVGNQFILQLLHKFYFSYVCVSKHEMLKHGQSFLIGWRHAQHLVPKDNQKRTSIRADHLGLNVITKNDLEKTVSSMQNTPASMSMQSTPASMYE